MTVNLSRLTLRQKKMLELENVLQHLIKFMLKFELIQTTNIQQKFVTAEKSPIFTSHKSYKNTLATI